MTSTIRGADRFRNRLLDLLERKHHWAWSFFMGPEISKAQLKVHYQQEYAVYVRDFPVFLARIHGKNPPLAVRRMLAENIFEEDTGKLSLGVSHPELFLQMMQGLGFQPRDFERIRLLPATRKYRTWLERMSDDPDWVLGAAVFTVFVEGSVHDRKALEPSEQSHAPRHTPRRIREKLLHHPLVQYHGVSLKDMDLVRAHQMVEGGHRQDAYAMVLAHAVTRRHQDKVVGAVEKTLDLWLMYRDGVARACGVPKTASIRINRVTRVTGGTRGLHQPKPPGYAPRRRS
jgi:pyrroloquinoline quinone (PQQ) biosynthesis protein C